jgi:hypothetical protein
VVDHVLALVSNQHYHAEVVQLVAVSEADDMIEVHFYDTIQVSLQITDYGRNAVHPKVDKDSCFETCESVLLPGVHKGSWFTFIRSHSSGPAASQSFR